MSIKRNTDKQIEQHRSMLSKTYSSDEISGELRDQGPTALVGAGYNATSFHFLILHDHYRDLSNPKCKDHLAEMKTHVFSNYIGILLVYLVFYTITNIFHKLIINYDKVCFFIFCKYHDGLYVNERAASNHSYMSFCNAII